MKVYMTIKILLTIGITLIFIGVILYGISSYMVRYYDKKINKHKFEILRPKPKGKKWSIHLEYSQ